MTTVAPKVPSLDPVIAEAKQRTRRRRLFVNALLVVAVAGTTTALIEARSPSGTNANVEGLSLPAGTRSCGILGVGIGWHLWASSTLDCRSGRAFYRSFFRSQLPAPTTFRGYACASRVLSSGVGSFSCARGKTAVIAISNH